MMAMERLLGQIIDALGIDEGASDGTIVRHVEQLRRERSKFRDMLDGALAPLVKRARKLAVGDYAQSDTGALWAITEIEIDAFEVRVTMRNAMSGKARVSPLAPDTPVTVLTPLVVKEGLLLLRKELGAQLVDYERPERPAG